MLVTVLVTWVCICHAMRNAYHHSRTMLKCATNTVSLHFSGKSQALSFHVTDTLIYCMVFCACFSRACMYCQLIWKWPPIWLFFHTTNIKHGESVVARTTITEIPKVFPFYKSFLSIVILQQITIIWLVSLAICSIKKENVVLWSKDSILVNKKVIFKKNPKWLHSVD